MRKFLLITLSIIAVAFTASAARGDVNGDSEVNIADVNAVIDIILNSGDDSNGDVNSDGEVNIADVNAIIDVMLGKPISDQLVAASDVNGDGATDISDVNMVINLMLGKNIFDE